MVSDTEKTSQVLNFDGCLQHHQDAKAATVFNLETWTTMVRFGLGTTK